MTKANIFSFISDFQNSAPVNVDALCKALGIKVNYAHLGADVAGMIEKIKDDVYLISVNANDPITRQRFTIAHELGHYVYHRDKMGDGIDDDRAYRSTNVGKYHNTNIGQREETQANIFAANLLMPWGLISSLQDQGISDPDELASRLGVSKQAMYIRLGLTL